MTEFWSRLDSILSANRVVIDRPKGSRHPHYPEIVYPLDYGYIEHTTGGDGREIDVWRGTTGGELVGLVGIVCTVDIVKGDAEYKLLIGCSDDDVNTILRFHNNRFMSAIAVKRI